MSLSMDFENLEDIKLNEYCAQGITAWEMSWKATSSLRVEISKNIGSYNGENG